MLQKLPSKLQQWTRKYNWYVTHHIKCAAYQLFSLYSQDILPKDLRDEAYQLHLKVKEFEEKLRNPETRKRCKETFFLKEKL